MRYSAFSRAHGKRAREIRRYPDGDVAGKGVEWNAKWSQLRELVRRFDAGDEPDTCPDAFGWGGRMDSRKRGQIRVRCEAKLANWFYTTRPAMLAEANHAVR